MSVSIDWATRIITVSQSFLTPVGVGLFEMNVNDFRMALNDLQDNLEGMPYPTTHNHNTEVIIGGVRYARLVELINNYTVTFEDGQYGVTLTSANNNIADVLNVNQVSVRSNNSAGLISGGIEQETLERLVNLLEADEKLTPTQVEKRHRITKELLLRKTVTGAPPSTPNVVELKE